MSDKRQGRKQSTKLSNNFFPLDIHKSMFINDLSIMLPSYYVKNWSQDLLKSHSKKNNNFKWEIKINYTTPKSKGQKKINFWGKLQRLFISGRNQESCYRLHWDSSFATQLAEDYPKSFVRSLEFHIGDEFYKNKNFFEYDIGGFKEQLQVKVRWKNNIPIVEIKEFFKVKEEALLFPNLYKELSDYLIADYLTSDDEQVLRRIQSSKWKPRKDISKELNENNIYVLLDRDKREIYFGETSKSLSNRYPENQKHHSFNNWSEYSIINLPPGTSNHTRLLIERVLINIGLKLFPNLISKEKTLMDKSTGYILKNKKK